MITCGWCGKHYTNWKNQCDSCGGPLPRPPGMELGPPPPPTPRKLPKGFIVRSFFMNLATILGLAFTFMGSLMVVPMVMQKMWQAVFPGFFLLGGLSLLWHAFKLAVSTVRSFRHGVAVEGKIASVSKDTTQTMNGQHPWKLVWHFEHEGQQIEGSHISFDSTLGERSRGQPLWVLYQKNAPHHSTIYPPLR